MAALLIGELAAQAGTTPRALRCYEEQGLLECERRTSGYRVYRPGAVARVRKIRDLLASGFTVEDVKSFVRYLDTDLPEVFAYSPSCAEGYVVGARRVAEPEEEITALTRMRGVLVHRMPWLATGGGAADSQAA
ncbi:MerR family transcriptional regulator [Streptomyces sp. NPDC054794]